MYLLLLRTGNTPVIRYCELEEIKLVSAQQQAYHAVHTQCPLIKALFKYKV